MQRSDLLHIGAVWLFCCCCHCWKIYIESNELWVILVQGDHLYRSFQLAGIAPHFAISDLSPADLYPPSGTPLQYSCLENPMDRGAWKAAVHGVAKSRTRLSDFTLTFHFHALEKEMATHSSVLAWRIPETGEPDGLPSLGSHRVGHD